MCIRDRLYDVERKADDERLTYEQRAELRTRLAYPILVRFEKWLVNEYPKVCLLYTSTLLPSIPWTISTRSFQKVSIALIRPS